jgi:hypothetical protein
VGSGLIRLLEQGGPWSQFVFGFGHVWVVAMIVVIVVQRARLRAAVARAVDEAGADGEAAVAAFAARLGPVARGDVGAWVLASFWVVLAAALVWSVAAGWDITRINDTAYMQQRFPGATAREIAAAASAALITRSFAGILMVPAALLSILAVDQIRLRPRTRVRDELRRRLAERDGDQAALDAARARADARWSWSGLWFTWLWLAFRGRGRRALTLLLAHIVLGVTAGVVVRLSGLTYGPRDGLLDFSVEPTAAYYFWQPLLGTLVTLLPGLAVALAAAMWGTGWIAARSRAE